MQHTAQDPHLNTPGFDNWYQIANADDIASPTVLIYPARIAANLRSMIAAVGGNPTRLRPHVKTHKMAEIVRMKLDVGITKFKAATIAEAEMVLQAGGRDVLLAYPAVGPTIRRWIELIRLYPDAMISALTDDFAMVQQISQAACSAGVVLPLYVDLDVGMHRTGIAIGPAAVDLYRSIDQAAGTVAAGLHAYDGHIIGTDAEAVQRSVEQAFAPVWRLRDDLCAAGLRVKTIIAGGSPTSALLARDGVEVGAGTPVLWDGGQSDLMPPADYVPAAVLMARVISRPAEDLVCIDAGHKAIASEMPQPRITFFGLESATPVKHSEEHLVLQTPTPCHLPVGSVLYGIPRHICPTIALHQSVWCVRDTAATETWEVVARNRVLSV